MGVKVLEDTAYICMSTDDYEKLSTNMAIILKYIEDLQIYSTELEKL